MHKQMDNVVGTSLLGAVGLSEAIIDQIAQNAAIDNLSYSETLLAVRDGVSAFEPMLAEHLSDAVLASWITGYDNVVAQFPGWLQQEFKDSIRRRPPTDPPEFNLFAMFDREPRLRLINVENAAARMMERGIMTRDEFDAAEAAAKRQAFTIAGDLGAETIDRVRFQLHQEILEGPSLKGFAERVSDILETSPLGPGHLENVYRTNLQSAYRDGRETIRSNPVVAATFPYQAYFAVHDARARRDHRLLETLGIDGTNVYNIKDEVWNFITPPIDYNCFLPGTMVSGRFNVGLKSFYSGQAIEIVTSSGNRLSVTANHPILTDRGFVAANLLREGDNCLSYSGEAERETPQFGSPGAVMRRGHNGNYEYDKPTPVEQVFSSIANLGTIRSLPLRPNDLHGDARFTKGNVDVVYSISDLPRNSSAENSGNGIENFSFEPMNMKRECFAGFGLFDFGRNGSTGLGSAAIPVANSLSKRRVSLELQEFHFGEAANLDASLYESPSDCGIAYTSNFRNFDQRTASLVHLLQLANVSNVFSRRSLLKCFALLAGSEFDSSATKNAFHSAFADKILASKLLNRSSKDILPDKIVSVRKFEYSGHVYDLQSPLGYMVSNSIVCSNCRCSVLLYTIEKAASVGVKEAQEWLRTGRAPVNPEYRLAEVSAKVKFKEGFGHRGNVGAIRLSSVPINCECCC